MEDEYAQRLTIEKKFMQIPIEEFEKDKDSETKKEKQKVILELFKNYNQVQSAEEFDELKYLLGFACRNYDVELIKIFLSEAIENDSKDFTFKIDKTNQTASLFKVNNRNTGELIIPRTVQHESKDYLITSIIGINNRVKTLKFAENSAVKTIYECAFYGSNTKEIYFPASLKELKEGWCETTEYLTKIEIPPSNDQFVFKEDKYLLGKSNENNNEFDILLFARRDIEEISIPPNIKIISSYAFFRFDNLTKVEIPTNSNLQTIGKYAFLGSKINEISIPPNVTKICKFAFSDCYNLKKVEIPQDSNLQTIEESVFSDSEIEEIFIPASLKELKEGWCENTKYLTKIKISPLNDHFVFKEDKYLLGKSDENNDEFDILLFVRRDIKEISIPPNVTKICKFAFSSCQNLKKVEIPQDSNLQTIEESAFSDSEIEEIFIPASLKELKEGWCKNTEYLTKIKISPSNDHFVFKEDKYLLGKSDENNDEFDILLFARRDIKEISIPSNAKKICEYAFDNCNYLTTVEIKADSNLREIGTNVFSLLKIKNIFIPPKVTKICESAFVFCSHLTKVVIPQNSNLQTIEESAFSYSNIKELYFPASLKELKDGWCSNTSSLMKIVISPLNSHFKFIDNKYLLGKSDENTDEFDILLFACRDIKEISIPSNAKKICEYAFENCNYLTTVEIKADSNLHTIGEEAFSGSSIKEIFIPSKVSKIGRSAFSDCQNLTKVEIANNCKLQTIETYTFNNCNNLRKIEIPQNSNLQAIEESAFGSSGIEELYFPSSLKELKKGWCNDTRKLTKIIVSPLNSHFKFIDNKYLLGKSDENTDEFDILLFASRDIKEISLPRKVIKICHSAFSNCRNLKKVDIPANSSLQTIEFDAFSYTDIKDIFVPPKVSKISEYAFCQCNFQIVEISEESELNSLSYFSECPNNIIMIPSSLKTRFIQKEAV